MCNASFKAPELLWGIADFQKEAVTFNRDGNAITGATKRIALF